MYQINFYDFSDTLIYTVPSDEIIDVQMSERSLQSEQIFIRNPQRVVINLIENEWIKNNIINMSLSNISDRTLCKYYIKIKFNNQPVGSYIILNDQLSNTIDSLIMTIICYDFTILFTIYSDLFYKNLNYKYKFEIDQFLQNFFDQIYNKTGLQINLQSQICNTFTVKNDIIKEFDYSEVISKNDVIGITNQRPCHSNLGYQIRMGFPNSNNLKYKSHTPFTVIILQVYQAYDQNATWDVFKKWSVRPLYRCTLDIYQYEFSNIVQMKQVYKKRVQTSWRFSKVDYVIDKITHQIRRPEFSEWMGQLHGYINNDNTTIDTMWTNLISQYNLQAVYLNNQSKPKQQNKFINFNYLQPRTPQLTQSIYKGKYNFSGPNVYFNMDIDELSKITIHREGYITSNYFQLTNYQTNYLDTLKDLLYIRKQSLYADKNGVIQIVNLDVQPSNFPTAVQNKDIVLLSKKLTGSSLISKYIIRMFNSQYLNNKLFQLYKHHFSRRQLSLTVLNTDFQIFDQLTVNTHQGYVNSICYDYLNQRSQLRLSVYDLSTVQFTVRESGTNTPLQGVLVSINSRSMLTNSSGKCMFFNIPIGEHNYLIQHPSYNNITGTVNVNSIDNFTLTKSLTQTIPKNPNMDFRLINGGNIISLGSSQGYQIKYTTNNTVPNSSSNLYQGQFIVVGNKKIRSKCFTPLGISSTQTNFDVITQLPIQSDLKGVNLTTHQGLMNIKPQVNGQYILRYTTDGSDPDLTSDILSQQIRLDNTISPFPIKIQKEYLSGYTEPVQVYYNKTQPIIFEGYVDLDNITNYGYKIINEIIGRQVLQNLKITCNLFIEHHDLGNPMMSTPQSHIYMNTQQRFKMTIISTPGVSAQAQIIPQVVGFQPTIFGVVSKYSNKFPGQPDFLLDISGVTDYSNNYPYFSVGVMNDMGQNWIYIDLRRQSGFPGDLLQGLINCKVKYTIYIEHNDQVGGQNWL